MPDPSSIRPAADRNLLFGILALQMDFITRDALIQAMHAWVLDKHKSLGQILAELNTLKPERQVLLDALVCEHLKQHGNDPLTSLESLGSIGSVRGDLEQLTDLDLKASLAHLSGSLNGECPGTATPADTRPPMPGDNIAPPPTWTPSIGTPSSAGLRFRILRPHARGGLGQVFVAHDEELHREVALKEIQEEYANHADHRARFLLEAEITGGLEHPSIVPVYGLGAYPDGRPFYAMRFIKGDSLRDAIQHFHAADVSRRDPGERSLALRQLLGRFVGVCNAVAYAHSRGVLHRDLKPANVMLGPYGETLVVDWGLAKVSWRADGMPDSSERTLRPEAASGITPTQMGQLLGTPQYMSPEQAEGKLDQLGPGSDIYSLGAILYCLLTGQAPFDAQNLGGVLQRVKRGEFAPPRQVKRNMSPVLQAVCLKAMALKPEGRYASARALADDIEHWLADEPVSAYREPWRVRCGRWVRRHQPAVAAVAALLLTAMVGAGLFAWQAEQGRQQESMRWDRSRRPTTSCCRYSATSTPIWRKRRGCLWGRSSGSDWTGRPTRWRGRRSATRWRWPGCRKSWELLKGTWATRSEQLRCTPRLDKRWKPSWGRTTPTP
jgi:serine/threonine-protein kinase